MSTSVLLRQQRDGVALLTLNRPAKKNAFNGELWEAFRAALAECMADDGVAAVVVTGAGDAFSAGQDLTEFTDGSSAAAFPRLIEQLCAFDKPLLAAVNGLGVGFGATFLLHCDVVYLSERARLRFPFAALGVVPEAASSLLLSMVVGPQNAAELLFTAEWIDAERAAGLGLAKQVLPPGELLDTVLARAREIAAHPVGGLRAIKRTLLATRREAVERALAEEMEGMKQQVGSPENLEALKRFFAKR